MTDGTQQLRSPDLTRSDLLSQDPERIRRALLDLKLRREEYLEFNLAMPGIELLLPFSEDVPEDIQRLYFDLVRRYRKFSPAVSDADRLFELLRLILRYANAQCCFDLAIHLKGVDNPIAAVEATMHAISHCGLVTPISVRGASYLVSRLLDGKPPIRKATLEFLRGWPRKLPYDEVARYIKPQLEPDELVQLDRD